MLQLSTHIPLRPLSLTPTYQMAVQHACLLWLKSLLSVVQDDLAIHQSCIYTYNCALSVQAQGVLTSYLKHELPPDFAFSQHSRAYLLTAAFRAPYSLYSLLLLFVPYPFSSIPLASLTKTSASSIAKLASLIYIQVVSAGHKKLQQPTFQMYGCMLCTCNTSAHPYNTKKSCFL